MKTITLTKGLMAIVDDADFEHLNQWKWHASNSGKKNPKYYALHNKVKMHHLLLPLQSGKEVDHINGNSLDNRRSNLRLVTHSDNCRNKKSTGKSKYLGVYWESATNKFRASIQINGKKIHLGRFDDEIEASKAYQSFLPQPLAS